MAHITDGFFEGQFTFWRIKIPKRLLLPFLIILFAKIAGAIIVYNFLDIQASGTFWFDANRVFNWSQNTVFLENAGRAAKWSYTFVGWDSAWYLSIMTRGYMFSPQSYVFSPGLPFFGIVFNLLLRNPIVSMAVCAMVFGVLWIPFYQLVAERYLGRQAALASTMLFALSPYTFLFTTVVYAEGLFLFFTLSAWYFFKKGGKGLSSGLASVSVLSRITGGVLILPMLLESLRQKTKRRVVSVILSLSPVFAFSAWLVYFKLTTNDFLPFLHVNEWGTLYTVPTLLFVGLPKEGINIFQTAFQNYSAPLHWLTPYAALLALIVSPFLIYKLTEMDRSLAFYSVAYYAGVLAGGALASTPRYLSVLFPLWIPLAAKLSLNRKTVILMAALYVICFLISLSMWVDFLTGNFIA